MKNQLEGAKDEVRLKNGEVLIVRSREEARIKRLEEELKAIQKCHEEDTVKVNAELKQAIEEKENLVRHNKFLQQDLLDVTQSVRNLKGGDIQGSVREKANAAMLSTPKKPRPNGYGDGFDDAEIMVMSPTTKSGGGRRSKGGTPTKIGGKRKKRDFQESPAKTLELSQSHRTIVDDEPQQENRPLEDKVVIQKINGRDGRYDVSNLFESQCIC